MPFRTVLSQSQRDAFMALPVEPSELTKYYTLPEADVGMIRGRRKSRNRLGFAVQLCLMRYPGRRLQPGEKPPDELIAFVAEQIAVNPAAFPGYAEREETRREHALFLSDLLQVETFGQSHYRNMIRWLVPIAVENPDSVFLVGALLNELRLKRILHPLFSVVERMVAIAKRSADHRVFRLINEELEEQHKAGLDEWLATRQKQETRLSWVRQPVGRPCPANVLRILEKLDAIKALSLPGTLLKQLPVSRRELLVEVDSITGFTEQFTHLRTGLPAEDKQSLLTVILSDAINLGLTRMAQACRGTTVGKLSWTADWYVKDDSYSRALAELVNFHHDTELVNSWGDGSRNQKYLPSLVQLASCCHGEGFAKP